MLILLLIALVLPLAAQQPDPDADDAENYVSVTVQPSLTGNVTFSVTPVPGDQQRTSGMLDAVPGALDCEWTAPRRTKSTLNGMCRGLLTPADGSSTGNLQLAPLVKALHEEGADRVWVVLEIRGNQNVSVPAGWTAGDATRPQPGYFTFDSQDIGDLPPNFPVPVEAPKPVSGLLIPMMIVLFAPGLLAYAIRLRATDASAGQKVNWIVWMNWINLAAWLYWISAINVSDLGESLMGAGFSSYLGAMGLGIAVYSFPPLIAVASCMAAMAPLLSSSPERFSLLLKRRIVAEASIIIPLGIFLVGSGLSYSGGGYYATFSLVGAYLVYRALAWTHWSMSYTEVKPVDSGELFERATALARKAGVKISRLGILQTRVREEANAFASSGGKVTLTESLIRGLTPREVDAVIAHELGHHKSGHLRFNLPQLLFWVYIVGAAPLFGWLTEHYHLPAWLMTVPITPVLFIALQGFLSQNREFAADARAAEITGDPEGKIAALARLAQLSRMPIEGGGIMGSIMSHPSMEKRVLALARAHNIPDFRALAILRNPDEAYSGAVVWPIADAPAQPEAPVEKPAFSLREKTVFLEQVRWLHLLGPLVAAGLIATAFGRGYVLPSRAVVLWTLGAGPVAILAFTLTIEVLWSMRFERQVHRAMTSRLHPVLPATFAGIHPGRGVRYTEGLPDWDFGFLSLEGDWLCYRGEKGRFSLPRQEVIAIEIVKGPRAWLRERRVEIVYTGGAFTLNTSFARPTMAIALRTEKWIRDWVSGASGEPAGARPEPPPLLPNLPGMNSSRLYAFWYVCKITVKLWVVGPLAVMAGFNSGFTVAIIMLIAPVAAFLRILPAMIWPIRRPRSAVDSPQANPLGEPAPS